MRRAPLWILAVLVAFFLIAPVLIVIPLALSTSPFLQFPPPGYGFQWVRQFFSDPSWMSALWLSARVALGAMAVAVIGGTMAAYAITRGRGRFLAWLEPLLVLPMIVPLIIYGVGAYLVALPLGLIGSYWLLIAAHGVITLPYVVLNVGSGLRTTDARLQLVAQSLGASPLRAFFRVVFPLIRPAIAAGALLAVAFSMDETVVALFLTSDTAPTLPVKLYGAVQYNLNPLVPVASAVELLILAIIGLLYFAIRQMSARSWRAVSSHTQEQAPAAADVA
jgi:putative spermidine/putrescine transport system permease protein